MAVPCGRGDDRITLDSVPPHSLYPMTCPPTLTYNLTSHTCVHVDG